MKEYHVKSFSINGTDEELAEILNNIKKADNVKLEEIIYIGLNSKAERIYQIVISKEV